jgi:aminoglycoside phosphotransferase (APT) family kinase protein
MYEWVAGTSPATIARNPEACERFFTDLGRAVAALHTIELERFTSRLDGSAPSFPKWSAYVLHRIPQIRGRCVRHDALDAASLTVACTAVERELGADLDAVVRPTLVHRDLHADNVLVDERGALVAILDWDLAEAWDPAAEWFKLDFKLFGAFPGGEATFRQTYDARHPERPLWDRRVRIVDLLETVNSIANVTAEARGSAWDTQLRARLLTLTRG